jgi:tetratricopeptide (TPR) repeat protein
MKMKSKKIVFLSAMFFALFAVSLSVSAQEQKDSIYVVPEDTAKMVMKKYGDTPNDSDICTTSLSLYREYYKQWRLSQYSNDQLLRDALPGWRQVFQICPRASMNVYIRGGKMYSKLIKMEEDSVRKEELIDTLILIHKRRIRYFGDHKKYDANYIEGTLASDLYKYRKDRPEQYYPVFKAVFEAEREKTEPSIMSKYFGATYQYVKARHAGQEVLFYNYLDIKKALEIALTDTVSKNYPKYVKLDKSLDTKMAKIATEKRIVNVLGRAYEADSTDIDLCNLIVYMSEVRKLTHLPIYYRAATQSYSLNPSPEAAYSMGRLNMQKEKYDEAEKYLTVAAEQMSDSLVMRKADAYLMLTETYFKQGKYQSARNSARKVLTYRPNDVIAYMYIGDCYASSKCEIQGLNVIYWAAYDKYAKALSLTEEGDEKMKELLRKKMGAVKGRFPDGAGIFQRNLSEGQSIKVECWVGETTTVRVR